MFRISSLCVVAAGLMLLAIDAEAFQVHRAFNIRHRTRTALFASNANELIPMQRGSTVALVTPFDKDTGAVSYGELRKLLQMHVEAGTNNLCILGTTGESNVLTKDERTKVLTTAVEEVKGKMTILAGTGTIDPTAVKSMTQQALDLGCDAALVVTPYYVKPPQRCLVDLMTSTADIGLPVVIYNVPGRTGVNMLDTSIALAAQHPNVVAVKDATGDVSRLTSLRAELAKKGVSDFLCYSGDDGSTLDFLLNGGDGCISVTANVAASQMYEMVHAALRGDQETAESVNEKIKALHKNLFCESNPIPTKYALQRMGLISSDMCRPPLASMDPQFAPQVDEALRQAGLLIPSQ